jgi:TRAP-type C4-dicarboxylate transport system permease small subunit
MYLFIAFSISWIYEVRGHLTASFIVDRLSARSRSILELVLHVLTFVFACLVTYLWWRMFISTFESGRYYLITRIVEWPFHLLATTAWGMLGVAAAHSFFTDLKKYFDKTDEIEIGSAVKP